MVRLGKRGIKASIVRKKLLKNIPPESLIEVYVSKIRIEEGTFEVCLNREEALEIGASSFKRRTLISASTLQIGDELNGIVNNVTPYGVFVDVNANRNGLLHISKVAKQRDAYVAKEDGLKALGLGRGSPINVIVVSNERKRLELDLAPPSSSSSSSPINAEESLSGDDDVIDTSESIEEKVDEISDEEAAMWAAYAIDNTDDDEDEYDEEDDEYDEDTDIEDALGIGYY
jgi:predicted RNA-binding protein with RPS1 domain